MRRRKRMLEDLDQDIREHIAMETQDNIERGMSPEEARRAALLKFGNVTRVKEETREVWSFVWLEHLLQDIRYSFRMLAKSPGFTAVAILTLALGIGANTAIFSLIDAVMLRNLPVRNPSQLVTFSDDPYQGVTFGLQLGPARYFSVPLYKYFRDHRESFEDIAGIESGDVELAVRAGGSGSSSSVQVEPGKLVSANYFSVLGVKPFVGRTFAETDDEANAAPAAVISYAYWKRQFNLDRGLIGRAIDINTVPVTIIGVTPPEFFGERVSSELPTIWLPLHLQPQMMLVKSWLDNGNAYWLDLIGRLKPAVTLAEAQASANVQLRQLLTAQEGTKLTEERKKQIGQCFVALAPGGRGLSFLRFRYSESLNILMVVVGLVLVIACANVANLMLIRAHARKKEISVRLALGASRGRMVRQLLTESALLGILGGIAGLLFSVWSVPLMVSLVSSSAELPLRISPDAKVLGFTLTVSFLTVVLFGLVPALRATRIDLVSTLKGEIPAIGKRGMRLGLAKALVVAQVSGSLVLLVGAGLFLRSLVNLETQNMGFEKEHVLLVEIDPQIAGYQEAQLPALYHALEDRIRGLPGVRSASIGMESPLGGSESTGSISLEGRTPQAGEDMGVDTTTAGSQYFGTEGIPLLLGRGIGPQDGSGAPPVSVVNQSFAEHFFPGENPIGKRFSFGSPYEAPGIEIVGVAKDSRFYGTREKSSPLVFLPIYQMKGDFAYAGEVEVRATGNPSSIAGAVRAAIHDVAGNLPVTQVRTLAEQVAQSFKQERMISDLSTFFGLLALLLACVGFYGTLASAVASRTHEIGIRMAIGAQSRDVRWLVLDEVVLLVGTGLAIGLPAALGSSRLIASQLFNLTPADPATLAGAVIVLIFIFVSGVAGYIPARRASRLDPMVALRYE